MRIADRAELKEKQRRVQEFLAKNGYGAMILGRRDNFSWFTCGGTSQVVTTTDEGVAYLVITSSQLYCVAHVMDGQRLLDDELMWLDIEPVFIRWYEGSLADKASQLIKGLRAVSDVPVNGAKYNISAIYGLHYPLTSHELEKLAAIGCSSEQALRAIADEIRTCMTEDEIKNDLMQAYARLDMELEVLLIGSDERIARYRHPNPSGKKVEKLVLLHTAARKWGLHANITRMVFMGDTLPADVECKYELANQLQAQAISMCIPGTKFKTILDERKKLLSANGFSDEWEKHFPGGITGYLLCDASVCASPERQVVLNQAYDWFITITGVKVEELSVNTLSGRQVLSACGNWPCKEYSADNQSFLLPQIYIR